ncbi:hypothetical protein SLEP1_g42873 [Rubroshorea leprosula]|uniref:DC1 domain-containing protein n=1 Tax=Rubroshorea leprosula TaxID=152421 RepID=A0AAV5LBF7_9ROSI|nr:hypothetical protein SLEP1_g42873 [Rubroshorea leprosula]
MLIKKTRAVLGALAFCTLRPTLPLSLGHVSSFQALDRDIFIQEYEETDENQNLNQIKLGWLSGEPSITHVLKKRKIGEEVIAIEIKHFNHRHELILCDDVKDEKCCDGCRRSISTSSYCCAKCNYILHKRCAELPRKTRHWAFKDTFTLRSYQHFICELCCFFSSGLGYKIEASDCAYCIPCFLIPDSRTWAPARYKNDEHLLVLTYRDDIHPHLDQCVCDICEESRDPNEWFYYCGICDNFAHFLCVLGKYPFLKLGLTDYYCFHEHPLSFAKEDYYQDYSKCSVCGKYCKDVFFKCTQSGCEYAIDWDCRKPLGN